MNEQKTLEQLFSIYGFKVLRFLKSKYLIIEHLYQCIQFQKWRVHFREHPREIFDS